MALLLCCYNTFAQPCQSITVQMVSTSPAGMGGSGNPIRICQGNTVSFTASATFSTSSAGAKYIWTYGDGTLPDTTNTLTASHTYPDGGVYIVDMLVVDPQGCQNSNRLGQVVQVSTTPIFAGTQPNVDTICLHYTAEIHGEAVATPGIYDCAPPVADTTFIPDIVNVPYTTSIEVACFSFGSTLTNASQLESICLNMEHSFLGDLQMKIICPNNQEAILKEYPGGGGTFLGEPNDPGPGNNIPGIGYDYCFANTATWGTMVALANTNTVPVTGMPPGTPGNALIPGTYTSFQPFSSLVGCPLNGNWTIHVLDNLGSDNGFIFSWGINFDSALLPGSYSFLPNFITKGFNPSPDIIATTNGGSDITVKPSSGGQKCYTYKVTDNFGCSYDTTVCIYVMDPGNPGADTAFKLCLNQGGINAFDYLGGNPTAGGTWSGTGVNTQGVFDPAVAGVGFHDITYSQSVWNCDTSATITINVVNDVVMDFSFDLNPACDRDTVQFTNLSEPGQYWWNFGDGTNPPDDTTVNPLHIYQNQDIYSVRLTVRNLDGCKDSITKLVDIRHPLIAEFTSDVDSVCQGENVPIQFNDASTGDRVAWFWDFGDGATSTAQNPTHIYTSAGTKQVMLVITDAIPCSDTIYHSIYVDSTPFLRLITDRFAICQGEMANFRLDYLEPASKVTWNFGDGAIWDQFDGTAHSYSAPGKYWVTVTVDYPVCASTTATDSVVVSAFPVVNLGPDSVICLDGPGVVLTDINNANNPAMRFLWSTGETTPSITAVHPGLHSVRVSAGDCATTEDVMISKDCYTDVPNAFTPNGDGSNDYFYPRQLLSKGVVEFSMTVFNRWGQKVFETTSINGRGWDGRFNEKDQPMGVYIYQMRAVMKNGKVEEYSGNVTLVR